MGKIKTNNYSQALQELKAIDKDPEVIAILPEEIDEKDAHLYQVALIQRINNETEQKYETRVNLQMLNQNAFEKASKGVKHLGFDKMILVHSADAKVKKATPEAAGKATDSSLKLAQANEGELVAKIEAKLREEYEQKFGDLLDQKLKEHSAAQPKPVITENKISILDEEGREVGTFHKVAAESVDTDDKADAQANEGDDKAELTPKTINLSKKNENQLKAFAKANEIDVTGLSNREEILAVLKKWQTS